MKDIFVMDKGDYQPDWPVYIRDSARAIIQKDGRLAMVYAASLGLYKFPGGGIEPGEDHGQTLMREVAEETGLTVDLSTIRPYGRVLVRRQGQKGNEIFEQENFYYTVELAEAEAAALHLDDYEKRLGFSLRWVTPKEAWETNRPVTVPDEQRWVERDTAVLKLLANQ